MKYLPAVIFVYLVFLSGCRNAPAAADEGWFDSRVEMSDSGAVYDVWLMARMEGGRYPDSLNIDIRIISPDSAGYAYDSFTMPTGRELIDSMDDDRLRYVSSEFFYDVESLYRTGIRPLRYGRWLISCRSDNPSVTVIQTRVEKQAQ